MATTDAGDYTTTYTYDGAGRLLSETDANDNTTTYGDYHPTGFPRAITDALDNTTAFVYDARGNVTEVTDANDATSSFSYDVFARPGETTVPKDAAAGEYILTPAPVYDANDNVVESTAPNGAVTTYVYDAADRMVSTSLPVDTPGDPERSATFDYDLVGNLLAQTEPNGTLTTDDPDDFTTSYRYDEIYQLSGVTNAEGHEITYTYDAVGNVATVTDPRKNAENAGQVTASYTYDLNHRVTRVTDAAGETERTIYDRDGLVTRVWDKEGRFTDVKYDARGLVTEISRPRQVQGMLMFTTRTRYEYDEVGNRIRVITPRGVATGSVADDFVHETVFDELNRPIEQLHPFDPGDAVFNTAEKTTYAYDAVGRLAEVSAPASNGHSMRDTTRFSYFDTGWMRSSTDAWDITTSYDYNELGQQTARTLMSAGGSADRTMTWSYYPDGKLAARGDDGVPVGLDVVLVDNTDYQNTEMVPTWTGSSSNSGYIGPGYRWVEAGDGSARFTWHLRIPSDGDYEVFVNYVQTSSRATDAPYTVTHDGGEDTVRVNQRTGGGQWQSIGTYGFTAGGEHTIVLSNDADGRVAADAVKLVRDNSAEVDTEDKDLTYTYDANGNLVETTDTSSDAEVDTYRVSYTPLNQVATVEELDGSVVVNTTEFTYDENGNPLSRTHDDTYAEYTYDVRDLVEQVSNADTPDGADPKVTGYTYTPNGWTASEAKPNGNTVEYGYFLDGLLEHQKETKPDGTVVAEHTMSYDANGNRTEDIARTMDADNHSVYSERTYTYTYDPRDRVREVTKTDTGTGATLATESYVHDAASITVLVRGLGSRMAGTSTRETRVVTGFLSMPTIGFKAAAVAR